ncbi:CLUMA_CG013355, isoform A [Clunio marinus]|uniref:CLUMA_CG013355, isoform A n=1 Tax=Clunio marinus TaxID=568069 RepID=A0A1J1IIQ2_9DIPT|nr:CLUMA_CG013355, isoform A [Clunio marinus]
MGIISFLFYFVCVFEILNATPLRRGGMVLYQSQPGFVNGNRAFIMQYASQPYKKRNAQASGVTAFVSGKKIAAGTYLKHAELIDDEQEQRFNEQPEGSVQSVANAYPAYDNDDDRKYEESDPNNPAASYPAGDYPVAPQPEYTPPIGVQPTDVAKTEDNEHHQANEDDDEEEEENFPLRANNRRPSSNHYFPVTFGSTYGGAIAIANSYSAGKAGSASSTATAYGSANKKSKKRVSQQ